ncbi:hypothetical protein ZWY2020_052323 [Hordeum vulgare]|nr:hypothetical protein ZWY2020_052323 [Hordeum vulgare]
MAPSPRPYTSLLLPSLLLLLLVSSNAVRAGATSRNHAAAEAGDDRCGEGGEGGDDECLMRRTLVAHTDYIYTQGGNHN